MSKQRRPTSSVASGTLQVSPDEAILETHYGRPLPGWVCGAAPWSADLRSPLASRAGSLVQPGLLPLSFLFSPLPPPAPTSLSTSPWIIILLPCNMHLVPQIPRQTDGISRKPFAAPGGLDWGAQDAEPQPGDWRRPTPPPRGHLCAGATHLRPRPGLCHWWLFPLLPLASLQENCWSRRLRD